MTELKNPGIYSLLILLLTISCHDIYNKRHPASSLSSASGNLNTVAPVQDTPSINISNGIIEHDSALKPIDDTLHSLIKTGNVSPDSVIAFAKTLIGVPYKYASTDPKVGFDCSGFITYVFNHFNIKVPRASKEFNYSGVDIPLSQAKKGDLILFTGTDSTERFIGHMGLIINNDQGSIQFIHSSSGKAYSVTISPLDKYYLGRFLKVIRIFSV